MLSAKEQKLVRQELDRILNSQYFKQAGRSRQFLEYVVQHHLEGHPEELKERAIGTDVFKRPPGYATGDDPIVRVQASEVRRRLATLYASDNTEAKVRIDLPVGSYAPEFHWTSCRTDSTFAAAKEDEEAKPEPAATTRGRWTGIDSALAVCAVILLAASIVPIPWREAVPHRAWRDFWSPVLSAKQPTYICLAKGVTYRPSKALYDRYRETHPGTFGTAVERSSNRLYLDKNETLKWGDLVFFDDYGVASGDVYAAMRVSEVLGRLNQASEVRIGSDYSLEDIRQSPAVLVGAFNNKWSVHLLSGQHFAFSEDADGPHIREQAPGTRVWPSQTAPRPQDIGYALVARLMDSKTGHFTVVIGGLSGTSTEAAGEFVSNPEFLEQGLKGSPAKWSEMNSIFVLQTSIRDSVPGPPVVVASYFW
jgi:hypothetical protein